MPIKWQWQEFVTRYRSTYLHNATTGVSVYTSYVTYPSFIALEFVLRRRSLFKCPHLPFKKLSFNSMFSARRGSRTYAPNSTCHPQNRNNTHPDSQQTFFVDVITTLVYLNHEIPTVSKPRRNELALPLSRPHPPQFGTLSVGCQQATQLNRYCSTSS